MSFDLDEITYGDSIKLGADDAPVKVVEYINLRCPYSKEYEETIASSLNEYIEAGQVQRILKHFDKEKEALETGNVLHQYIDYETPATSYNVIKEIFAKQDEWKDKRLAQIPHLARELGLSLQAANEERSKRVLQEVKAVNVELVPTIFVEGEAFVGTADLEEFKAAIEKNLD